MHYLVDGYNFAHRAGLHEGPLEGVRRRTASRLRGLARRGDRVTVVWDAAGAPPGVPRRASGNPVEQVFARGATADEEILSLVREAEAPRGLCVVTDDRGVSRPARAIGAAVMGVREAVERLGARGRLPGARGRAEDGTAGGEKPPPPTGAELDEWERLFGEAGKP
ncbi:MAG: NYN domain-containing protein [Planctomycetes bacterium]|nr:NYN domain-containing protein [Planctomycetota bacterium]